jgi:hypothetical protein
MVIAGLWFLAGAAVEVLNTLARKWTVDRLQDTVPVGWITGGFVLRLVVTSGILVLAFRHEATSGVAALAGYLLCRWVMIWWIHRSLHVKDPTAHQL